MTRKRRLTPYVFLAPALILLGVFVFYPIAAVIYYSLTDYDIVRPPVFIGLDNFVRLLDDDTLRLALLHSFLYLIVTPILTMLFFIIGMVGAYLVAVVWQHVDHGQYVANIKDQLEALDVIQGIIKSVVFGLVVILVGCYQGFHATGGGRGVGLGTTRAVVIASVSVLVMDYFLTDILLTVLGSPVGE